MATFNFCLTISLLLLYVLHKWMDKKRTVKKEVLDEYED